MQPNSNSSKHNEIEPIFISQDSPVLQLQTENFIFSIIHPIPHFQYSSIKSPKTYLFDLLMHFIYSCVYLFYLPMFICMPLYLIMYSIYDSRYRHPRRLQVLVSSDTPGSVPTRRWYRCSRALIFIFIWSWPGRFTYELNKDSTILASQRVSSLYRIRISRRFTIWSN